MENIKLLHLINIIEDNVYVGHQTIEKFLIRLPISENIFKDL